MDRWREPSRLKGQTRTILDALATHLGKEIPEDHPLMSWAVQYACAVTRSFVVGPDGKTPAQRVRGRHAKSLPAEFGEKVWYMPLNPQHVTTPVSTWGP